MVLYIDADRFHVEGSNEDLDIDSGKDPNNSRDKTGKTVSILV